MRRNLLALFIFLILAYFLYLIREDIIQYKNLEAEKDRLDLEIVLLEKENRNLELLISKANSNWVIEKMARERLNLVKKGEIAYKICQ